MHVHVCVGVHARKSIRCACQCVYHTTAFPHDCTQSHVGVTAQLQAISTAMCPPPLAALCANLLRSLHFLPCTQSSPRVLGSIPQTGTCCMESIFTISHPHSLSLLTLTPSTSPSSPSASQFSPLLCSPITTISILSLSNHHPPSPLSTLPLPLTLLSSTHLPLHPTLHPSLSTPSLHFCSSQMMLM